MSPEIEATVGLVRDRTLVTAAEASIGSLD